MKEKRKNIKIVTVLFSIAAVLSFCGQNQAATYNITQADCGKTLGVDIGEAGDTFVLTENLVCTGHGLIVGANNITIDGNNHTITGPGNNNPTYRGVNNFGGYDNITIQNFANITNFGSGVYFNNTSGSIVQNVTATLSLHGINLLSSTDNIITGNTTNLNKVYGIYLNSSTGNNITDNTTNSSLDTGTGIYLDSSTGNTVTGNTASLNMYGIQFSGSSTGNTLTGNTVNSNTYGIRFLGSSTGNTFTGNVILNNQYDIYSGAGITNNFFSNQFSNNITNEMVTFVETNRTIDVGATATSSIMAYDPNGTDCNGCASVTLSPSESSLAVSTTENQTDISFIPTQTGIYSLNFTVTDANTNVTKRRIIFLVGATSTRTSTQYFRGNVPTHGQTKGNGHDIARLLLTPPTSTETWYCSTYINNFCDEIDDYPLVNLLNISQYIWYKHTAESGAFMGIKRFGLYDPVVDYSDSVDAATHYTWINNNFIDLDLNWAMDYPQSWYWLAFKFMAGTFANPYGVTFPASRDDANHDDWDHHMTEYGQILPSRAEFTYEYTTTPAIKSISDENVMVLSAIAQEDNLQNLSVVLEDILTSQRSVMYIALSDGSMELSINEWQSSGLYYREWKQETSSPDITATHTISGFAPNNYYIVYRDGAPMGYYPSNGSGQLTFDSLADGTFATHALNTIFQVTGGGITSGGNCFIATASYGTPFAEEVTTLRNFRDEKLLTNPAGRIFVNTYYKFSPKVAEFISERPLLKNITRNMLKPVVWFSKKIIE